MKRRLLSCVKQWPECAEGEYNPSCCRFPKSCSCTVYDENIAESELEPVAVIGTPFVVAKPSEER